METWGLVGEKGDIKQIQAQDFTDQSYLGKISGNVMFKNLETPKGVPVLGRTTAYLPSSVSFPIVFI